MLRSSFVSFYHQRSLSCKTHTVAQQDQRSLSCNAFPFFAVHLKGPENALVEVYSCP